MQKGAWPRGPAIYDYLLVVNPGFSAACYFLGKNSQSFLGGKLKSFIQFFSHDISDNIAVSLRIHSKFPVYELFCFEDYLLFFTLCRGFSTVFYPSQRFFANNSRRLQVSFLGLNVQDSLDVCVLNFLFIDPLWRIFLEFKVGSITFHLL